MQRTSAALFALTTFLGPLTAGAQSECSTLRHLFEVPEIPSKDGLLQGVILLKDQDRLVAAGNQCRKQGLRYVEGYSTQHPKEPWPYPKDPIPGPTFRARVGDLVQLTFLNQIDYRKFSSSLDQGELGKTTGCDEARVPDEKDPDNKTVLIYPRMEAAPSGAQEDTHPNCLHGSSTANIHFHGTHTTPSTTGDNVLLFIRPALRQGEKVLPEDALVEQQFAEFFKWCAANGAPTSWKQMPVGWQEAHRELLHVYDATAPYQGQIGNLPHHLRLWPKTEKQIAAGLWPQYSIGNFPYCFSLPKYDPAKVRMGQAPGTHWYHAHKHGSTSLNVGNSMAGAFIIEGEYDDALRDFYKPTPEHKNWGLVEKVLVIQQIQTQLNLLREGTPGPPPLSVNGRLNPALTMKPNQVQHWRVINTAPVQAVQFHSFASAIPEGPVPEWRQIAQDGVQLAFTNYQRLGKQPSAQFNLAAANRADLLVRAPALEGEYVLRVVPSTSDVPGGDQVTLLTVEVKADGAPIDPPMGFIETEEDFPKLPEFLEDIAGPIFLERELRFNTVPRQGRNAKTHGLPLHKINEELFNPGEVSQTMTLDATEEWTIYNETPGIAHPFHIHINPFQIVEVFQPNLAEVKTPGNPCYANPLKPETWKPCAKLQLQPPYVWWDVFGIPTARREGLSCTKIEECPQQVKKYTSCNQGKCSVTIPGYFKMRSRFVDFPGQFVLHCHILAHEDRGMMQLVEVISGKTPYEHH